MPVAGFSSNRTRVEVKEFGDLGDMEQSATDLLDGQDYTHFIAMMAPRPVQLAYNGEDSCCYPRRSVVKPLIYRWDPADLQALRQGRRPRMA